MPLNAAASPFTGYQSFQPSAALEIGKKGGRSAGSGKLTSLLSVDENSDALLRPDFTVPVGSPSAVEDLPTEDTSADTIDSLPTSAAASLTCELDGVMSLSGPMDNKVITDELLVPRKSIPGASPLLLRAGNTEFDNDIPPIPEHEELHQQQQEVEGSSAPAPDRKLGPGDFELLRVVGQGAFGKVFQVQHKETQQVYAMKVMRKDRILQKDHSEYVRSERDVLTTVVHPYIVTLRFSFQTPTKLYLVLDFINGGHLFFNLYRQGVFSEEVARLYTAEIVLAISYLHSIGIMHRDLKPENVLLDSDGHVKLTDFGLAKSNMSEEHARSNSFIGTMEYMAPEIIQGKGHTKSVDWWSTGILLYEMLCGVPPFRAKSRQALQQQILTSKVKYPKFLSSNSQALLKALLQRDPAKRLGSGPTGSEDVQRHPFFKPINWAKLEARQMESKFKPEVTGSSDINNFDKLWTDQPIVESPCGTPSSAPIDAFKGFTYIAPGFLAAGCQLVAVAAAATAVAAARQAASPVANNSNSPPPRQRITGFDAPTVSAPATANMPAAVA